MSKIRVVHVLNAVGGVDVYLRLLLTNVNNAEFENIIIHSTDDAKLPFTDKDGNILQDYKLPIYREISPLRDIQAIYHTFKLLKELKPDIVHTHSAKGGVIGRIAAKLARVPVLYTPHAFSYLSTQNPFKRNLYLRIEKLLRGGNSALLATSPSEANRGVLEVGFKKEKVLLYNNSIEPPQSGKPLSVIQTWPDKYICTVGRPSYQKNTLLLIEIMRELSMVRNIHLVLMGVGHYCEDLQKVKSLIAQFNLQDKITMLDWAPREDIFTIISNSQLYISTSRYEGLPYSIIESMALGKPCVVSDCDGNRDLIIDGYNGYVIKTGKVTDYADKICTLLDYEIQKDKMGENAKRLYEEKYNIITTIKQLEQHYKSFAKS